MEMINEKKIKQLQEKIDVLKEQISSYKQEITNLELKYYNYIGKFIDIPDYGKMYVYYQKFDEEDEQMFFQGFKVGGEITEYNFWVYIDAMDEWHIPIDMFNDYAKNNEIQVISKEEFIKTMKDKIELFSSCMLEMLDKCIENNKK